MSTRNISAINRTIKSVTKGDALPFYFFFRKMQDQSRFEMHLWYLERKRLFLADALISSVQQADIKNIC